VIAEDGLAGFAAGSFIDVSGGAQGGNGGFAEVSGPSAIFGGSADLRGDAPGHLLIDPAGIRIVQNGNPGDDLLLNDGSIDFNEGSGTLDISAATLDTIFGDITLEATDFIDVLHPVVLTSNQNLHLFGRNTVSIHAPITGARDLIIRGFFGQPVGDTVLIDEDIDINGDLIIDANILHFDSDQPFLNVTTGGSQIYDATATMYTNANFTSTGQGDIVFEHELLGQGEDVNFRTGGTTAFLDGIGKSGLIGGRKLGRVFTDSPGETIMTEMVLADEFDINDPLRLNTNVRMVAEIGADFARTIDGQDHSFEIQSPFVWFHDHATNFTLLKTQEFRRVGVTRIGPDPISGGEPFNIEIEGDRVHFDHDVFMRSAGSITGHEWVRFQQTLDGNWDTVVRSNELIRYDGDVGSIIPLLSLTNLNDGVTEFRGTLVRSTNDITFDFLNGVGDIPEVATISGLGGDLRITSVLGDVTMAEDQKITVTEGSLQINAVNGIATLSDLNARDHIAVTAPWMAARSRIASIIRRPSSRVP